MSVKLPIASITLVFTFAVLVGNPICFAQQDPLQEKLEVPPKQQLDAAAELVREVYRKRFEESTSAAAMSRVAKQILMDAEATSDDPVSRYVMLRSARQIAIRAGDAETTLATVDAMDREYLIDETAERTQALVAVLQNSSREPSADLQKSILRFVDRLAQADDYDTADQILTLTLKRTRSTTWRRTLETVENRVRSLSRSLAKIKSDAGGIDLAADDPKARLQLGRFLCFIKEDWNRGFDLLKKCDDEELRELVVSELASDGKADGQLALADRWWEYAESLDGELQAGAKRHAGTLYQEASSRLTGLRKAKSLHRLDEAREFGKIHRLEMTRRNGSLLADLTEPGVPPKKAAKIPEDVVPWPDKTKEIELPLPGAFDDVALAGKGRFLLLQFSSMNKIVVLDLFARKFVHEIKLDQRNVLMTANATSLFLATPDDNMIERRSLTDFKPDRKVALPFVQPVMLIEAGYGSKGGPVYVSSEKGPGQFLGASTLKPGSIRVVDTTYLGRKTGLPGAGANAQLRANADGTIFAHRETRYSPNTMRIMIFAGRQIRLGTLRESVGYLVPSPNGQLLYTSEGVYTNQLKPVGDHKERFATSFALPAVTGDLSIRLVRDDDAKNKSTARMTIHRGLSPEPLVTLPSVRFRPGEYSDFNNRDLIGIDQRIYFYPDQRLLVTLPSDSLSVVFHRLPPIPAP